MSKSYAESVEHHFLLHSRINSAYRTESTLLELSRIGVMNPIIVEPVKIDKHDQRLDANRSIANLSATCSLIECFKTARRDNIASFAFYQDDVVFRRNFAAYWAEVSDQYQQLRPDVLTLYRWPMGHPCLNRESFFMSNQIILHWNNICNHAILFRRPSYDRMIEVLEFCIQKGWPDDFFYGVYQQRYPDSIHATTRNIVGQRAGWPSATAGGHVRRAGFYRTFFTSHSLVDYYMITCSYRLWQPLRKRLRQRYSGVQKSSKD